MTHQQPMNAQEVADHLRIHVNTVYRLVARGELPHTRVGHKLFFDPDVLTSWIQSQMNV